MTGQSGSRCQEESERCVSEVQPLKARFTNYLPLFRVKDATVGINRLKGSKICMCINTRVHRDSLEFVAEDSDH